ncbi:unnamed protein product, partial [Rotaria magnacalcarata]
MPGVSIIKPLTGIDANLYENLKTFFNLQYPRYEILFCVQEHDNELIDIIERLREQYPRVDSQLFVGTQSSAVKLEHEVDEEQEYYDMPLVANPRDEKLRRKQVSLWKRIFCC